MISARVVLRHSSRLTGGRSVQLIRPMDHARSFSAPAASPPDATPTTTHPPLKIIPSLPLVGSMIPFHSGLPAMQEGRFIESWRTMLQQGGPFFRMGFPGFGTGSHGIAYVVRDPHEMLRVLKQEGAFPSGIVEKEWPMIAWMKNRQYTSIGLLGRGEDWKRIRNFVQKDILGPQAAREYLPGILNGAKLASAKAAHLQGNEIMTFMNHAAFDMFSYVLFGDGKKGLSEEDYHVFCTTAVDMLDDLFNIMRSPLQVTANKVLGIETPWVRKFYKGMDRIDDIAQKRLKAFMEKAKEGRLSKEEEASYCGKLAARRLSGESDISEQELIENAMIFMVAAVDTTAGKTAWNVLQLALNPEIQERIRQQLVDAAVKEGQNQDNITLTPGMLEKAEVPLLHAFVRETHRCTPPLGADMLKELSADTVIHGETLPKGSAIMFDSLTNVMDPELVDNPRDFVPERWLSDAVEARKNTPAAIIDHPFYAGPFSQGARRCPGSRVAYLEVQAMIAQLLLDYKIQGPANTHWQDVGGVLKLMFVPDFPSDVKFVPRL